MERIVDHFATDLDKIIELVLAMPDDKHKKQFIQVNNTIKIEYYYLYLIQELLIAMRVLKKDVTVNSHLEHLNLNLNLNLNHSQSCNDDAFKSLGFLWCLKE